MKKGEYKKAIEALEGVDVNDTYVAAMAIGMQGDCYSELGNFKKAKEFLETGVDLIIDDASLEINFYVQLGEAFNGLGDMKKKEQYFTKADALIKKQKR